MLGIRRDAGARTRARMAVLVVATAALVMGLLAPAAQAATKPGAPPTSAVPGNAKVTTTWSAPANGGKAIVAYQLSVQRYDAKKKAWGTATLYLTSATARSKSVSAVNASTYRVRTRAKNALGWGTWSAYVAVVAGTPTTPRSVAATATTGTITVTWATPSSSNGAAVSAYGVDLRTYSSSTKTWGAWASSTLSASARAKSISAAAGSVWQTRVRAKNSRGWGPYSPVRAATVPTPPPPPTFTVTEEAMPTTLSVGVGFACAIRSGGTVRCWGGSGFGQLGNGSTSIFTAPPGADVTGLTGAVQVSAKLDAACAVTGTGGVVCWGSNNAGVIGSSAVAVGSYSAVPVPVEGLPGPASSVTVGFGHACAVMAAGGLWCWGMGGLGQLGDGVLHSSTPSLPVQVVGLLGPAVAASAGYYYTCAIVQDASAGTASRVQCWGYNNNAEVGVPISVTGGAVLSPATVSDIQGATAIAAGKDSTCAVDGGAVKCWGGEPFLGSSLAYADMLAIGDARLSTPYVADGLGAGMLSVAIGESGTCASSLAGRLWCWGNGGYNGDPAFVSHDYPWQLAELSSPARSLDVGYEVACARLADATVWCWGDGRIIDGTQEIRTTPVQRLGV